MEKKQKDVEDRTRNEEEREGWKKRITNDHEEPIPILPSYGARVRGARKTPQKQVSTKRRITTQTYWEARVVLAYLELE